jgi:hypothetical protein
MRSIEQDGVTVLVLNEAEREIVKRALESVRNIAFRPAEIATIEAAVKFLTRFTGSVLTGRQTP